MFKVICIHAGTPGKTIDSHGNKGVYVPALGVGNEYHVVEEVKREQGYYYELAEIQSTESTVYLYSSKLFAQLSDLNELDLVEIKEEVYA